MQKIIQWWHRLSFKQLLWFTAIASLLLSVAELSSNRPIDPDSITFINAAYTYWQGGWHAAIQVYPWPFFPIACIWLSHLSFIPLTAAFHLLNTLAQALLCIAFVMLNRMLGAPLRVQKMAALVILLYPFLNSIRVYATRESGYWAFALIAVCFLIRFITHRQNRDAIAFGLSMLVAFLFRVEGLLMLIAAPLALLALPGHRWPFKWRLYCRANIVLTLVGVLGLIVFAIKAYLHPAATTAATSSRLYDYYLQIHQLLPHLSQQLATDAHRMGQAILTNDAKPTEKLLLVGGLANLCVIIIVSVMQPVLAALAIYGQCQDLMPNRHGQRTLLYWLLILNFCLLLVFTLEHYFLATRYPAFLTLLWLSWVPFSLDRLYDHYRHKNAGITGRYWFFPSLMVILAVLAIGGIVRFGHSKAYITQAGDWLYQHTPAVARLYTNSKEVAFYAANSNQDPQRVAQQDQQDVLIALKNPCQYDWIALRLNRNDEDLHQNATIQDFTSHHQPQITFANKRRDSVLIYAMQDSCQQ